MKKLVSAFNDSSDILSNGLHIGSVKYFVLKSDDRSIYGKKVRETLGAR